MLGKQWLNRYAATEMRGTTIERSQNRQRKLDGVITWYFDHVMESLPLMLQAALLLLACALSRYLLEINVTVASVVLGVTSFGVIFYIFIVVAGAASVSCPYQTPGARIFRHIFHHIIPHLFRRVLLHLFRHAVHHILPTLRSALSVIPKLSALVSSLFSHLTEASRCHHLAIEWWSLLERPWYSMFNIVTSLFYALAVLPIALIKDVCILGGEMVFLSLLAFFGTAYGLVVIAMQVCGGMACRWFVGAAQIHSLDQRTIALDLQCILWMLQTSLDKAVHLSTLKHLATMMALGNFDPALVSGCFDVFIDCVKVDVNDRKVVIMQGLEQLATVSAACFLRTFHHLSVMNPTSPVLDDVRQRYSRVFPFGTDFSGLPFYCTMTMICSLADRSWNPHKIRWGEWRPSAPEWISFTRSMAEISQAKYQRTRKVPRWILRLALHSLSLDPLPPMSAVADCLSIIANDLGCDVSNTGLMTSDERCVRIPQMAATLTLNQYASGASCESDSSESRSDSQRWRSQYTPIQAQGDHRISPVRDSAGARWTT